MYILVFGLVHNDVRIPIHYSADGTTSHLHLVSRSFGTWSVYHKQVNSVNPEVRSSVQEPLLWPRDETGGDGSAVCGRSLPAHRGAVDRPGRASRAHETPREPLTTTDAIVGGRAISNLICSAKFIVYMVWFYISPVALTKIGVISAGFTNSERKLGIHQLLCHDAINWRSGEVGGALLIVLY